ncbi:MAG: alpha/beta hydrolase [Verrucomicrobia bacterium]|nr:MAG: alpha/beta hydrolase [Verrucomicrobiota bacterium]
MNRFIVWLMVRGMVIWALLSPGQAEPVRFGFPLEKVDQWHGHQRHVFEVAGKTAWVVVPDRPREGRHWTWVTEFPDAFLERTGVPTLLKEHGVYHAHVSDFNRLGCAEQLQVMSAFYELMVQKGFAKKPVLIGLSRGGFMAYRWAVAHPQNIAGIYGDAPVCDLKSWPAGQGQGKGSPSDWQQAKKLYGWTSDEQVNAFQENPVDDKPLAILAKHRIPLYHVVGRSDDVVPVAENSAIVERKYRQLGGSITVIAHEAGHHPHGLDDPAPTVNFIVQALQQANR